MSGNGQGPKLGKVVRNGPGMVARACQASPEVPTVLSCWLRVVLGPGGAAKGQFRLKLSYRAAASIVGGPNLREFVHELT